jgi:hypothetical protein
MLRNIHRQSLGLGLILWLRDNIKMDLQELEYEGMDWIELAQNRDRWRHFECGNEPSGYIKCVEFLD